MIRGLHLGGRSFGLAVVVTALAFLPLTSCGSGDDGAPGAPGASTGTLSGTVKNSMTGTGMAGVVVTTTPAGGSTITTDSAGNYSAALPLGAYSVACAHTGFAAQSAPASIVAANTSTVDFSMVPNSPVQVTIGGIPATSTPGGSFTAMPLVVPFNGSSPVSYMWKQAGATIPATEAGSTGYEAPFTISDPTAEQPMITLGSAEEYKLAFRTWIKTPPRWDVLPINPFAFHGGEGAHLTCMVTMDDGSTYESTSVVNVDLPYATWTSGIRNVPVGLPVLMNGKVQPSYDWALTGPTGTATTLMEATTINPWFVPDMEGEYLLTVTDTEATGGPIAVAIEIFAGEWAGGITGEGVDGPVFSECIGCHSGSADWNAAYADWRVSGHAHIFSVNINAGGHYGEGCFDCHTVGYDTSVDNNGIDDQDDYQAFLDHVFPGGHIHGDPTNWAWTLANTPNTARRGNIQCENCHGPQGRFNDAHAYDGMGENPRFSDRADVCAYCHGEPPRHGRFQQWQTSAHGNYELAMAETRTFCNYCHTVQGYLSRYTQYVTEDGVAGPSVPLTPDEAHPITCVTCHPYHYVGTKSGHGTDAPMRVVDNAYNLNAGFDATNVGKGAVCITCHNSRRGLANDCQVQGPPGNPDQAPHGGPQSDVVMGQNAFFVQVPARGAHGFLKDNCVTCHLTLTPPPAELSYNLGGTNHAFAANYDSCTECHGSFDPANLVAEFDAALHDLEHALELSMLEQMTVLLDNGYTIVIHGHDMDENELTPVELTDATLIDEILLTEFHGRSGMEIEIDGTWNYGVGFDTYTEVWAPGDVPAPDWDEPDYMGPVPVGTLAENGLFGTTQECADMFDVGQEVLLMRGNWNYWLLHSDGSHSIHNPGFASDIIIQTLFRMNQLNWSMP